MVIDQLIDLDETVLSTQQVIEMTLTDNYDKEQRKITKSGTAETHTKTENAMSQVIAK